MNISVIYFVMGAQGEKVRAYAKGTVCKDAGGMIRVVKNYCLNKQGKLEEDG